jgi:hypothetical protein
MHNHKTNRQWAIALLLSFALFITLMVSLSFEAQAQTDTTPTPSDDSATVFKYDEPAYVEGGDAEWTLSDSTFTSNYPDGFEFEAVAESSAGDLESVSVYISHTPAWEEDLRVRGEVDNDTGRLHVVVDSTAADGIPPWVAVNYRWRILDSAGTIYWSEWFTGAEYEDSTREWHRQESEDLTIFWMDDFPQEGVDLSFEAMAEARPIYEKAFGRLLSYKPRMMLFSNLDAFQEWRGLDVGAGGSVLIGEAQADKGAFVQVLYDGDMDSLAFGTVIHEIAHMYQNDLYESRAPSWWIEGNATLFEIKQDYDYEARVREFAADGQLPRLFVNGGPGPNSEGPDGNGRYGYDVGYTFNLWLVQTFGWESHRAIIDRLAEPENMSFFEFEPYFIETLEVVLEMPIDEIEGQWRVWLGADASVPTLFPTPTIAMNFPATVTPFQFATPSGD